MNMTEDEAVKVLGVKKGAGIDEIQAAYKQAALKTHPDKGGNTSIFEQVSIAKSVLIDIAMQNGKAASSQSVLDREDIKNVIVFDDRMFLLTHEKEFVAWREPNMEIMGKLNANNKRKETAMILDYCRKGSGGGYMDIENYLRTHVGISSPYHMADRVNAIKMVLETFRKYIEERAK